MDSAKEFGVWNFEFLVVVIFFEIQVLEFVIYVLFARQILFHISFGDYRVQSFRLDVEKVAAGKLDCAVFNWRFLVRSGHLVRHRLLSVHRLALAGENGIGTS